MSEPLHHLDELFRQNLNDYQAEPSDEVWQRLEARLDDNDRKPAAGWLMRWWPMAAAAALAGLMLGWYGWQQLGDGAAPRTTAGQAPAPAPPAAEATTPQLPPQPQASESTATYTYKQPAQQPVAQAMAGHAPTATGATAAGQPQAAASQPASAQKPAEALPAAIVMVPTMPPAGSTAPAGEGATQPAESSAAPAEEAAAGYTLAPLPAAPYPVQQQPALPAASLNKLPASAVAQAAWQTLPRRRQLTYSLSAYYRQEQPANTLADNRNQQAGRRPDRDRIKQLEQTTRAYSTGLQVQATVGGKLGLYTGLQWSGQQTQIAAQPLVAQSDGSGRIRYRFDCANGFAYFDHRGGGAGPAAGDTAVALPGTSTTSYLGIPLGISYAVSRGKWKLRPQAELSLQLLQQGNITGGIQTNTEKVSTTQSIQGLRSSYWSGTVGLPVEYGLSNRLGLQLMPTYRFGLSPINSQTAVRTTSNAPGLSLSLRYQL